MFENKYAVYYNLILFWYPAILNMLFLNITKYFLYIYLK